MMKRIAAVLLVILATLTAAVSADGATRPRFRPAVVGSAGDGRYVVTLAEDAAMEDPAALRQELALIYGAKLEVNASSDARQFTVTTASARARLLSADPRVVEVVEVPITAPAPSQRPASSAHLTPRPAGYGDNGQSGTYSYDGAGNIIAIGADSYVYDSAQRLVSSVTRGVQENYTYDAYGNRTSATGAINCLGQTNCAQAVTVDSNTNHLTLINGAAVIYDAAGNIKTIAATSGSPSAVYSYDALGMMTDATVGSDDRQFIYTADDERIAVRQGASWTWMIRDQSGKVLREFTSLESGSGANLTMTNWQWAKDYVWRDGLLLATVSPSGTLHYHLDHLGTPRLITDANGVKIAEHAYYPFGAEINLTPHETIEEAMKFTGHERDLVAGEGRTLDYMHARYYSPTVGRFLSVDPGPFHPDRPQSWNRYAYVQNNPLTLFDPNGRQAAVAGLQLQIQAEIRQLNTGQITRAEFDRRQELRLNTMMVGLNLIGIGEAAAGIRSAFLLGRAGFSAAESGVITQTAAILKSGGKELIAAFESGEAKELTVAGQKILVQPDLPVSGMTLQGEGAFVFGQKAFASSTELTKTVLHEMYRLTFEGGSAASAASAAAAAKAAFNFAETAFDVLSKIPF